MASAFLLILMLAGLAAALLTLALALFHVRYRAAWRAELSVETPGDLSLPHEGSLSLEFGFPGFMRRWERRSAPLRDETEKEKEAAKSPNAAAATAAPASLSSLPQESYGRPAAAPPAEFTSPVPDPGIARAESPAKKDPNRIHKARKALFRLATDGPAWGHLARYGFRALRLAHRLLRPRIDMAVGHPDPALLGRLAGRWYAVSPLLPLRDASLGFRFQDRRPTFGIRAGGGFSLLSLLCFGAGLVFTLPVIGLGRRAWHGWRRRELEGWRAWTWRRIQTL